MRIQFHFLLLPSVILQCFSMILLSIILFSSEVHCLLGYLLQYFWGEKIIKLRKKKKRKEQHRQKMGWKGGEKWIVLHKLNFYVLKRESNVCETSYLEQECLYRPVKSVKCCLFRKERKNYILDLISRNTLQFYRLGIPVVGNKYKNGINWTNFAILQARKQAFHRGFLEMI